MTLCLAIAPLAQELQQVCDACDAYITDVQPIQSFRSQLERLRHQKTGTSGVIEIPRDTPIKTKPSTGDYRPNGGGALTVVGTISCKWEVSVLKDRSLDAIVLDKLVSTTVTLIDVRSNKSVAVWNFDVADAAAPGCHFHMQTPWPRQDALQNWPETSSDIDVPRFPIPFVLPTDALEFLLGELFQQDWPKHRAKHSNNLQGKRVKKLFEWQTRQISDSEASPWLGLKLAKPRRKDGLFENLSG